MALREKPKRKALHRGLDDIVNRDASLTSRLLGRVRPLSRDPLDVSPVDDTLVDAEPSIAKPPKVEEHSSGQQEEKREVTSVRTRSPDALASVHRLEEFLTEKEPRPQGTGATEKKRESKTRVQAPRTNSITSNMQSQTELLGSASTIELTATFDEFVTRWGFILRSGGRTGKLRICQVLFNNSHAVGKETFFTSYEKLAKLANLEKKQCAINIRQLEKLGFVERLHIFNTATKQGTIFKLHLNQLSPGARKTPQHHQYDEDLPQAIA